MSDEIFRDDHTFADDPSRVVLFACRDASWIRVVSAGEEDDTRWIVRERMIVAEDLVAHPLLLWVTAP